MRIVKNIHKYGFTCGSIWIITMFLFYFIVPLVYLISEQSRDSTTSFNILLGSKSETDIVIWICFCAMLILLFCFFYEVTIKRHRIDINRRTALQKITNYDKGQWLQINKMCEQRITLIADVSLLLGIISIITIIISSGGLASYLALGSSTRGIGKDSSLYISSSLLPLITLSNIIIIAPFLYKYLLAFSIKRSSLKIKFILSFVLSVIYLLYNQGRLPLILFFVPFVLDLKVAKKVKVWGGILIVFLSIPLLNILSAVFIYFTYGYWSLESNISITQTLLLEFTYPFSNFINKGNLVRIFGFRYGIDYIQWPLLLIPSPILKLVGIFKSDIYTIGSLNTSAYSSILNAKVQGGIPTDFFTFNYYQFGVFSLLLAIIFFAILLKRIDNKFVYLIGNSSLNIIILRICFLLVSLVNNFDFSVIFRMRYDILILVYVVYYIYSKAIFFEKEVHLN